MLSPVCCVSNGIVSQKCGLKAVCQLQLSCIVLAIAGKTEWCAELDVQSIGQGVDYLGSHAEGCEVIEIMYQQRLQYWGHAAIIVEHNGTGCIEYLKVDVITGKIDVVGILKYDVTQITE
jgi:hypothetical protein